MSAMEKLGIQSLQNHCYRELSGGQQQRVLIARALCAARKMLILDEPITGLDPWAIQDFYGLIRHLNREEGVAIFMVTHDSYAASFCDRVIILKDGLVWRTLTHNHDGDEMQDRLAFQDRLLDAIREMGKE